jgi:hypothetical protein
MSDELTYTVEDDFDPAGISDRALFDKTNLISNMDIVTKRTGGLGTTVSSTKKSSAAIKTTQLTPRTV